MLPRLRFFFEQAIVGLWRSIGVTALAVITIGVALGLLATFAIAVGNLAQLGDRLAREVEISAYLSRGLPEASARERLYEIAAWPEVSSVHLMGSTEALAALKHSLGGDERVLE